MCSPDDGLQAWMECTGNGASYNPSDPLGPLYKTLVAWAFVQAQAAHDTGGMGMDAGSANFIESWLRARKIIYGKVWNGSPNGGCGTSTAVPLTGVTATKYGSIATGAVGTASEAGLLGGTQVGTDTILGVSSATLGAATLGIGAVLAVVGAIFAHHAAAVAKEQATACGVMLAGNGALADIPGAFPNLLDRANAYDAWAEEVVNALKPIEKPGNLASGMGHAARALAKLMGYLATGQAQGLASTWIDASSAPAYELTASAQLSSLLGGSLPSLSSLLPSTVKGWAVAAGLAFLAWKVL